MEEITEQNNLLGSANEEYYWESYAHPGIHDEMLKDRHRTLAYKRALTPSLVKGKVVLDVGCGTGVLSLFAARSGAKKVYSVEMSAIGEQAKEIITLNGYDNVITVLRGKMEEVIVPEKVDIIVSEWMGYNLMYESMLASVIFAKDKYLKDDGIILPDTASIFIIGINDEELIVEKQKFWGNVYGFDFSCVLPGVTIDPLVDYCDSQYLHSSVCKMITFDIKQMNVSMMDFTAPFEFTISKDGSLSGICLYFDCTFVGKSYLSTKPETNTHWKQTCFYFDQPFLQAQYGDVIKGEYHCRPSASHPRHLDISISCGCLEKGWKMSQEYRMN
ncbi:type I protein arginine methyltransferase [Entamoeba marina]